MSRRRATSVLFALAAAAMLAAAANCAVDAAASAAAPAGSETQAVRRARSLIAAGQLDQAIELLEAAAARWPSSPEVHTNLGYAYELAGRPEEAVEQYAAAVAIAPGSVYAAERLRRLFYGVHFPTRLRISHLGLLPVRFARFQVKRPDGRLVDVAVTVTGLFPEAMRATSRPVAKVVPPGVLDGQRCEFNRVIYVFVGRPGAQRLSLSLRVFYPSRLLSREGHDYSALAASLARMAARFEAYLQCLVPSGRSAAPLSLWLCEAGPAGAEHKAGDIFIYRITALRRGEEWVRELAHELGHARLPQLAGWTAPEASLAGDFAERWLLAALCYEAEMATGGLWPDKKVSRWVSGLWSPGALQLADYITTRVAAPVRKWLSQGPYLPPTVGQPDARDVALGLLLWTAAAHGPKAAANLFGPQGTLPALAAAYLNWASSASGRITLAARACAAAGLDSGAWLPFGQPPVQASPSAPLKARIFLPAGSWRASDGAGEPLLVRWTPLGQKTPTRFADNATSNGAWGILEIAPPRPTPIRVVILSAGGEA